MDRKRNVVTIHGIMVHARIMVNYGCESSVFFEKSTGQTILDVCLLI